MRPCLLILVGVAAFDASARAQVDATAELLFREATKILFPARTLSVEELALACDKLQHSVDIEPALGSLNTLGYCRDKQERYASALDAYLRVARFDAKTDAEKKKVKKADEEALRLQTLVSTIRITVPESARLPDLIVSVADQDYGTLKWDVPIPIDGGSYRIWATAPDHVPWESTVTVASAQAREEIVVPLLERAAREPLEEPVPERPAPDPVVTPEDEDDARELDSAPIGTSRLRMAGLVTAGAGALAGIFAVVLELEARGTYDDYLASDPLDERRRDSANAQRTGANVCAVAAGVAIVGGAVLWYLGRPTKAARKREVAIRPEASAESLTLSLGGEF